MLEGDEPWRADYGLSSFIGNPGLTKEEQLELRVYTEEKIRKFRRNLLKVECTKKLLGEGRRLGEIGEIVASLGGSEVKTSSANLQMPNPFTAAALQSAHQQKMLEMKNQIQNQMAMRDVQNQVAQQNMYGAYTQQQLENDMNRLRGLGGMK